MNPKWYNKQENNCHELFKKAEISVKKKKKKSFMGKVRRYICTTDDNELFSTAAVIKYLWLYPSK